MKFDDLFEQRALVAKKLKEYIRDQGYTKISFSSQIEISRPTLDKLLKGEIDNKTSFDRYLRKIMKMFNLTIDELILYRSDQIINDMIYYSKNDPKKHQMSDQAKEEYALLEDIIDLCSIYY